MSGAIGPVQLTSHALLTPILIAQVFFALPVSHDRISNRVSVLPFPKLGLI